MGGKEGNITRHGRQDRLIKEKVHDPYMKRSKPVEPTVCPECEVVFVDGRWQWNTVPSGKVKEKLCPACQRKRDKFPAGLLTLRGDFFKGHRSEILRLVQNKVENQKAQHPMKRLMGIEEQDDGSTQLTFTDTHLPRGVGQAIADAYGGEFEIQYTEEAGVVRAYWER
ncbi:MAG: BCAM0308 family protein [Thermodesulfobacteriota bacterium]|nr:BCAM0308 family protein [Thermodesulfobacteriota bacterium]